MIRAASVLLVLLVLGNGIVEQLQLPIPGAALGLAMLASIFAIQGGPDEGSQKLFELAAPHFSLLFVPAAVGVVDRLDVLAHAWIHVAAAVICGTAVTLAATGLITQAMLRGLRAEAPT